MQYSIDIFDQTAERVMKVLSDHCRKRRLDKGLSRRHLAEETAVPAPTIARFETSGKISLESFARIAIYFGYFDDLTQILGKSKYTTASELKQINDNRSRKKGR